MFQNVHDVVTSILQSQIIQSETITETSVISQHLTRTVTETIPTNQVLFALFILFFIHKKCIVLYDRKIIYLELAKNLIKIMTK